MSIWLYSSYNVKLLGGLFLVSSVSCSGVSSSVCDCMRRSLLDLEYLVCEG